MQGILEEVTKDIQKALVQYLKDIRIFQRI